MLLAPGLIVLLAAGLFSFDLWRDYRLRIFPGLYGFARRETFSLLDSLPALSPGLSNLEAYKLTADPSSPTNADRSVWLADSLTEVNVEFYSAKLPLDSVTLYLWSPETGIRFRTLKTGNSLRWSIPVQAPIRNWTEVVGFYISMPPTFTFRSRDSTVRFFERIEGRTIHIVRTQYRDREESVKRPDTSWSISRAGEVQLITRGKALAILNPSSETIYLRTIQVTTGNWEMCRVRPLTVNLYRTLLPENSGPMLAYTNAGQPYDLPKEKTKTYSSYFWLNR